jgi:hypothetical protein
MRRENVSVTSGSEIDPAFDSFDELGELIPIVAWVISMN